MRPHPIKHFQARIIHRLPGSTTQSANKSIILFIVWITGISASGQNIQNLDQKYGINIFKLGSTFSTYSGDCTFEAEGKDGVKYYQYSKWFNIKIFNSSAGKEVKLGFYKDKLYTVSIDLLLLNDDEYNSLLRDLESLFGDGIPGPSSEMYDYRYFWKTEKTYLGLEKYSCKSSYNACKTNIFIVSSKIAQEIKSDGF
ncbi:MAG: hypothetical protein WD824_18375 [Cyclobacteriaceae bacterium]